MSQYTHQPIDLGELSRRKLRTADNLRRAVLIHNVMRSSLTTQLEEPAIQIPSSEPLPMDIDSETFDFEPEKKDTAVLEQDWLDSILDDLEPELMDTTDDSDAYSPPSSPPELDVHSLDSDSDSDSEDEDVTTPLGPDFVGDTYFFSDLPYHCNINRAAAQ